MAEERNAMNVIGWLRGIWSVDVGIERESAGKLRVANDAGTVQDLHVRELFAALSSVSVHASCTTTTAIDATATVWPCTTAAGAFTITLPTAVGCNGRVYHIKKTNLVANALTVATTSSQTIDGQLTQVVTAQWTCITVVSDGADWMVI